MKLFCEENNFCEPSTIEETLSLIFDVESFIIHIDLDFSKRRKIENFLKNKN